jgi:hypothetical protein
VREPGLRLPLQGGLPPVDAMAGAVAEIACDESGFSGRNLLDPATPVITHASVDLRIGEAVELMTALRSRFLSAPNEFGAGPYRRDWLAAGRDLTPDRAGDGRLTGRSASPGRRPPRRNPPPVA